MSLENGLIYLLGGICIASLLDFSAGPQPEEVGGALILFCVLAAVVKYSDWHDRHAERRQV
ncbi:MAG: hypothetical protein Q7T16_04570 [Candidatus Burarchaeum sp.]|nr:hypothetical protein [Candidatus Burarchaeum sp.]MDO8339902.1 hypothetical protein [Candidatus Burarchaeum sp.]